MAAIPDTVLWRGVNHLALVTPDMDTTVRFWHGDERLFADADPVPALTELRDCGALDHTVSTRLVDGVIEDIYRTGV